MKARQLLALPLLLASLVLVGACGDESKGSDPAPATGAAGAIKRNPANASTSITVGSKNFTEQRVLGELFAQALGAAGYKVQTRLDLGNEKRAVSALKRGTIDAYPEYTGTALLSLCGVAARKVPKDPTAAFEDTRACFAKMGFTAFPPTPFTSSNEVAVTGATARRLKLRNISDLKAHDQDLILYGTPECRQRTDCLRGLRDVYGLHFRRFAGVDPVERHDVLKRRQDAVSIVYTTDPQNKREDIALLEDDKGMFPPYNSTFVARDVTVSKAGPDLPRIIERVQVGLTDEVMQELNARVDLDEQTPRDVALGYLRESGLIR
jgi:osmoprotectant transport system substrate-binding protein